MPQGGGVTQPNTQQDPAQTQGAPPQSGSAGQLPARGRARSNRTPNHHEESALSRGNAPNRVVFTRENARKAFSR